MRELEGWSFSYYDALINLSGYGIDSKDGRFEFWVVKEEVCARTGGSCVDFLLRTRFGGVDNLLERVHITSGNEVVDAHSNQVECSELKLSKTSSVTYKSSITGDIPLPTVEEMLAKVKSFIFEEGLVMRSIRRQVVDAAGRLAAFRDCIQKLN